MRPESLHRGYKPGENLFTHLVVTMHTHVPLEFPLFILPLFCSALSKGLTDVQINTVKQRLQEGATHRSALSHIPFLSVCWSLGFPSLARHHYPNVQNSNDETCCD